MITLLVPDNTRSGRMCRRDCSGLILSPLIRQRMAVYKYIRSHLVTGT